jgi:hypothetical protein
VWQRNYYNAERQCIGAAEVLLAGITFFLKLSKKMKSKKMRFLVIRNLAPRQKKRDCIF